ncbi:hypothetical protein [Kosakonia sacchari]|uniref:hypothetical protein n=1 Tax=Kosakonia sacchari TaxID=1158459 RepID=UPI001C2F3C5E|nr:hypothetical protein [Kosakonia sacchari]
MRQELASMTIIELVRTANNYATSIKQAGVYSDLIKELSSRLEALNLAYIAQVRSHSVAITDIIAERQRQQSAEGWTPEHDDEHNDGQLAIAASCYALMGAREQCLSDGEYHQSQKRLPYLWPWEPVWWKPTSPRRDLVKAAALIAAEIERIDRAASQFELVKGVHDGC